MMRPALISLLGASILGVFMAAGLANAKFERQDRHDAEVIAQLRAEARR